ncbi:MAG TPA: hypothetical protein VF816_05895 [Rhodocyclaceae bacterium]
MLKPRFLLLLLPLVLGACASPLRINLASEQRAKLNEVQAKIIVVQDEVIAAVQPSMISMATGGGLLMAAIDSSITNSRVQAAQKVMGRFYAEIEDVDYRKEFNAAMQQELQKYPIRPGSVVTTPRGLNRQELQQAVDKLEPGQALLVIMPRYFLSMDFRNLDAEAWVTIWTKGDTNAPVHRGVIYYQSQPVGPGGPASMEQWADKKATRFRSVLRESIAELSRLAVMEVDVVAEPPKREEARKFGFSTGAGQIEIAGNLVHETADRVLVLGTDGKLYSLPRPQDAKVAQR